LDIRAIPMATWVVVHVNFPRPVGLLDDVRVYTLGRLVPHLPRLLAPMDVRVELLHVLDFLIGRFHPMLVVRGCTERTHQAKHKGEARNREHSLRAHHHTSERELAVVGPWTSPGGR